MTRRNLESVPELLNCGRSCLFQWKQFVEGRGLEAPLSSKMTQWSCYCIGESVCYWLEKGNYLDTWRRRTYKTWRWRTTRTLLLNDCFIVQKYNTFSDIVASSPNVIIPRLSENVRNAFFVILLFKFHNFPLNVPENFLKESKKVLTHHGLLLELNRLFMIKIV